MNKEAKKGCYLIADLLWIGVMIKPNKHYFLIMLIISLYILEEKD